MTTTTCGRCGRQLKDPKAVEIGFGKVCAAKLGIKFSASQKAPAEPAVPVGPVEIGPKIICHLCETGDVVTNVPHRIVRHSPTGFAWGYDGSGPADFALNALACIIGQERAEPLHQEFKRQFISVLPKSGGEILVSEVLDWVAKTEGR